MSYAQVRQVLDPGRITAEEPVAGAGPKGEPIGTSALWMKR